MHDPQANPTHHVYVLVRTDLTKPQITVQACHAAIAAARKHLSTDLVHPSLVVCGVKSQEALQKAAERLQAAGVTFETFYEADLNNEATALATKPLEGDIRRLFRKYQLLKAG